MGFWSWLSNNAFNLVAAIGVIGALCFDAVSHRSEAKTRRVANLLTITSNHRETWKIFLEDPRYARIRNPAANISAQPITEGEEVFVNIVIQHSHSVHYTMQNQLVPNVEGMRRDIGQFFSLPIPNAVWNKLKPLQNDDFVEFVEMCRNSN